MTTQALIAVDRRIAPRFATSFAAELAAGTVLVPVTVQDLSATGCGIAVVSRDPDLPDKVGSRGILHLPAVGRGTYGTVLPVALRNVRAEGGRLFYGLEFGPLLTHQTRKLMEVLDAMCADG